MEACVTTEADPNLLWFCLEALAPYLLGGALAILVLVVWVRDEPAAALVESPELQRSDDDDKKAKQAQAAMMTRVANVVTRQKQREAEAEPYHPCERFEMVCLVYSPAHGSCYKEILRGTRGFGDRFYDLDIRWEFSPLPPGTYRVNLAVRMAGPHGNGWEITNTEDELRGKSSGLRSMPALYGCTLHVKARGAPYPSVDKRHWSQPFAGVEFVVKRPGEFK